MPASQTGVFNTQQFTNAGLPLIGGRLYTYATGTTTFKTAFTDVAGAIPHTYTPDGLGGQYLALDARGELPASLYLAFGAYDLALKRADASTVWTRRAEGIASAGDLAGTAGAGLVGFVSAGAGAKNRTILDKLRDTVSVKDYGAIGDGVTDDTAAFTAALAAGQVVIVPFTSPGYILNNVVINGGQTLEANGVTLKASVGASCILRMTGFRPILHDAYFEDSASRIPNTFTTNAALIVKDAIYPTVSNTYFVNVGCGMLVTASLTTSAQTTKGTFENLRFDTVRNRGIYVGPNVNTCTFTNIRIYVGSLPSGGLQTTRKNCIGFQIASTGSLLASGGHIMTDIDVEQADTGFQFTDVQLSVLNNCFADTLAGTGVQFTGACDRIKVSNLLAGTALVGVEVTGTCTNIWLDSIQTFLQGVVPPDGDPATFFNAGAAFDVAVRNSASVLIGSWFGDHKLFADPTANIAFEQGDRLYTATPANIAAATTVFLGPIGTSATDVTPWTTPRAGVLLSIRAQPANQPGAGQSFTYTARVASVNTGLVATVGPNSFDSGTVTNPVNFSAGQPLSISLATSSLANATQHRVVLSLKYF